MICSLGWFCLVLITPCGMRAESPVTALAFTPDGKTLLIGSQAGVELQSWPDLKALGRLDTQLDNVHDLAFAPNGKRLLVAGGTPAENGRVEVWDWPERKRVRTIPDHGDVVYRVAWSPDGTRWASASADGSCKIFDPQTGKCLRTYAGHSRAVLSLTFLPDGQRIASGSVDQTIQLWEVETGKLLRTLDNHVGAINELAVRPTKAADDPVVMVSISDDRTVRIWQPGIGRLMRFARLPSAPRCVAWSENGEQLLIGCNDGHLRVVDVDTLVIQRDQDLMKGRIHSLAPHPKDHTLVIGAREGITKRDR